MTVITETFRRLDKTAPASADVGFVYFTVDERRYDGAGDFVVVQVRVPCRLVSGVLTSPDLVAGPALVQIGSVGPIYEIQIPESANPVPLWPLIDAGMPQPPAGAPGFVRNGGGVEAADLADLRRQVDNLAPRVESMTEKVAMYDDYLQYDANWHRDINLHGAERGWEFPPPEHISFLAFMRQRQQAGDF